MTRAPRLRLCPGTQAEMGEEFSDFGSLDRGGEVLVPKSGIPCRKARAGQSPARRLSQGWIRRRYAHSTLQMSSGCPCGERVRLSSPCVRTDLDASPWSRTRHISCSAAIVRPSVVRTSFAKSKGRPSEIRPPPSFFTPSPLSGHIIRHLFPCTLPPHIQHTL